MPGIVLANRAAFLLASSILPTSLTFSVQPGTGSRCPEISGGNFAYMVFKDSSGNFEVVRVTGHAAGSDVFTMSSVADRGLDGTTARTWLSNDVVRMSLPRVALWEIMNGATTDLGVAAGTANSLSVTADPPGFVDYGPGQTFKLTPSLTNTGPATLAVGARSARAIYDGANPIADGDLRAGYTAILYDDGTRYQLINPAFRAKRIHTHATSEIVGLDDILDELFTNPTVSGSGITLPANATANMHAVPLQQLQQLLQSNAMPPGMIVPFVASNAPAGWLIANGAVLSRALYPALYEHARTSGAIVSDAIWLAGRPGAWSDGDGSTTFRVPDFRGLFLRAFHFGSGSYDDNTGTSIGQYRDSRNKSHAHSGMVLPSGLNTGSSGSGTVEEGAGTPNYALQTMSLDGGVDAYPRHVPIVYCIKI